MLEDRPVTQKALIGAGAFMFIFSSAMAGTGFMISGGFGSGEAQAGESSAPSESYLRLGQARQQSVSALEQRASLDDWERDLRREAAGAEPPSAGETPETAEVEIQTPTPGHDAIELEEVALSKPS